MDSLLNSVPLMVVVDAKDVHDKGSSDTSSFGSQKSLVFSVAWIRAQLRRPNTCLKSTATENMFADAGTKHMDLSHLRSILKSNQWSVTYSPAFVKQATKGKKPSAAPATASSTTSLPGDPVDGRDPFMGFLLKLGESTGWHHRDGMGVNVAFDAKSFRTPEPRFSSKAFPLRSTFARYGTEQGEYVWRTLERNVSYTEEANQHQLLLAPAPVLVTCFTKEA